MLGKQYHISQIAQQRSEPEGETKSQLLAASHPNANPALIDNRADIFQKDVWQNAAILIDKSAGWTSFDVCGKLRRLLKVKKVGHAGTLDPAATGLMIVCTGRGCKQTSIAVIGGVIRLGEGTPSFDSETEVEQYLPWEHIRDKDIWEARQKFVGSTMQLPPMYSAIKVKGQRLYKAARKGQTVQREERPVVISEFDLKRDPDTPQLLQFRVTCSKGTYIRSLAHDLGKSLGTVAHLSALRRLGIGKYSVSDAWTISSFQGRILARENEFTSQ